MADVVVDADVLMNMVASGELEAILGALHVQVLVCPQVEAETLFIEGDTAGSRENVDLEPLFVKATLVRAVLSEHEVEQFVTFAAEVDDGEAQALAIASVRGLVLATDDRRATRVAVRLGVATMGTPELILQWAATSQPARAAAAVENIAWRAHFIPRTEHPLRSKWDEIGRHR